MTTTEPSQNGSITVLHVDDDPQLAETVGAHLERINERISVIYEQRAEAGLQRLQETTIDCIISDYQMPGTDGLEFLEAVRSDYPSLPFILYTGKGSEDVAAKAINEGVDAYVQKKVGSSQYSLLVNHITTLVEKHRTEKRLAWIERNTHLPDVADGEQDDDGTTESSEPSVGMQVVRTVAELEDVDPVDLPPLYEVVDADLLDAFVASASDREDESALSVTFEYHEYSVTIDANQDIHVADTIST